MSWHKHDTLPLLQQLASTQQSTVEIGDSFPTQAGSSDNFDAVATNLESTVRTIFDLLFNRQDLSHPFLAKHISPTFRGTIKDLHANQPLQTHISTVRQSTVPSTHSPQSNFNSNPYPRIEILSLSIEFLDDSKRRATVWAFCRNGCLPMGLGMESVGVCHFSRGRSGNVWVCKEVESLRHAFPGDLWG